MSYTENLAILKGLYTFVILATSPSYLEKCLPCWYFLRTHCSNVTSVLGNHGFNTTLKFEPPGSALLRPSLLTYTFIILRHYSSPGVSSSSLPYSNLTSQGTYKIILMKTIVRTATLTCASYSHIDSLFHDVSYVEYMNYHTFSSHCLHDILCLFRMIVKVFSLESLPCILSH